MKSRHLVTLIVVIVVVALLGGVLLRLRDADATAGVSSGSSVADSVRDAVLTEASSAFSTQVALPVLGAIVRRDTFTLWADAKGRAKPIRSAALHAEVAGPVITVPVREGAVVSAGAPIARIDPAEYQLDVKRQRAELEFARSEYEGLLLDLGALDEENDEVRAERERLAMMRSRLPAAEASLEEAEYRLAKTEIRAPFAGRVANLAIDEGARLNVGDSVALVVDLSRIDVDVEVLERSLPFIEPGRDVTVGFAAVPDESFSGRVVTVNPLVDEETGTARVTVRLNNPGSKILPGMFAEVRIAGRQYADRTFVPREAIVERDRRDVVFIVEPDGGAESATGLAKWVYVTTGLENDRFVEVTPVQEGTSLEPGTIVLVDGHTTLTHDARIRVDNADELGGRVAVVPGPP